MEFLGTKGGWKIKEVLLDNDSVSYDILANMEFGWGDYLGATTSNGLLGCSKKTTKANAQLIAHAPQLLEMLKKMVEEFNAEHASHYASELCLDAIDLIKQATTI